MEDGIVVLNNIVYVLHLCYYASYYVEMVGKVLTLRIRGTITFQPMSSKLAFRQRKVYPWLGILFWKGVSLAYRA